MADYSLVVFDIAGTTVRDKGHIAEAFIDAFDAYDVTIPVAEVNKVMGWRKKDAIRLLLDKYQPVIDEASDDLIEKIHDQFIRNMIAFYETDEELRPLNDAEEIFVALKEQNIKVALNTGFTRAITDVILKRLNWRTDRLIDFVIASDEVPEGRPHPYMIHELMKRSGVTDPLKVIKVGDTEVDIQEGRNAGCGLVVAVTTGAYTKEALSQYNPDHIIDGLKQLPALML
jgi:phosphonatase-like hydrolase